LDVDVCTAARRRGVKAVTMSKRPKTFVSNISWMRVRSASIAGASYTVSHPLSWLVQRVPKAAVDVLPYCAGKIHIGGEDALVPALLYNISSVPPVRLEISVFTAAMLSRSVTSSASVSIPLSARLAMDLRERAVAKTRRPRAANSSASAFPAPPCEHLFVQAVSRCRLWSGLIVDYFIFLGAS
jgi:hypothetical protein